MRQSIESDSDRESLKLRVLYSFPHKLGADRICYTAWQQVNGLAKAGADVLAFPGVLHRPVHPSVRVRPTLSRGKLRLPYKALGMVRTCALHDQIVARRLEKMRGEIDMVHAWPLGALETLKVANKLGIPSVLERPNTHTRFAYEAVQQECERLGVALPADDAHAYKADVLRKEEEEYREAFRLLCPSDFVVKTFVDQGTPRERLATHGYGFDPSRFYPGEKRNGKFTMLFAGTCAVRKGVHYALEAWLRSLAHEDGIFLIAGEFLPAYAEKLAGMLAHPSVKVLGHRDDVPELMRESDIFVLPTVEEGSPLVCLEAMGSGCVPVVSEVCAGPCRHMENSLLHRVGDVEALKEHITLLHDDRGVLQRLRAAGLKDRMNYTWDAAGAKLLDVYRKTIDEFPESRNLAAAANY
jgi:D-inositol-3-phosphate glycosyltransferase